MTKNTPKETTPESWDEEIDRWILRLLTSSTQKQINDIGKGLKGSIRQALQSAKEEAVRDFAEKVKGFVMDVQYGELSGRLACHHIDRLAKDKND